MSVSNFKCRRGFGLLLFVFVFAIVLRFGMSVSLANSPAAASYLMISPENVPEEAVYLELLIPMSQDDPYYCSFNQPAADETGLTEEAPIVQYRDGEGYISYSFHMVNAVSRMKMQKDGDGNGVAHPLSFGSGAYAGSETHLQYIQRNFGTIKAALVDREGNVLSVSDAASVKPGRHAYLTGVIDYDCAAGRLSPDIYKGARLGSFVVLVLFLLLGMVYLTVRAVLNAVTESAVAFFFRIRPWPVVFLVNFISNIIFNLLLFVGTSVLQIPYLIFVAAGEAGVVYVEYLVYHRRLVSCGQRRILIFTITANLTSFLLGIGLNYLLPGIGVHLGNWLI